MKLLRKWVYYGHSIFRILFNVKGWIPLLPSLINTQKKQQHIIRIRKPSLQFTVRGAMDLWSIKETFLDAFYTRYGVPIQNGWQVVDIGAGIGDFSLYAAHGHPDSIIYAFEPFPESFNLLQVNLARNSAENVLAYQTAIWGKTGHLMFDPSIGEPLQMVTQERVVNNNPNRLISVNAISLEDALDQYGLGSIDLLKLDCEGVEYEILMCTASSILEKIKIIIMEYHDLDDDHNHAKMALFLEDMGYKVSCYENFVHEDIGYMFAKRG